jgi:hypothetical protein
MTKQKGLSSREKSRILKLSASGKSATAVSKKIGRNRRTVSKYLQDPGTKELLSDIYERLNRKILASITPEDMSKANLLQKTTSSAIMTDKTLVLRGQPTQIHVSYLLDAVEAIREMRQNPVLVSSAAEPIEVQAPAPDLHEQQPQQRIGQPASYTVERHGAKYYSCAHEPRERRIPLQQDPDPD